jgi:hypothetical protein
MNPSSCIKLALATAACLMLNACGEKLQVTESPVRGKYQGKPDTRPWDNDKLSYGAGNWEKGKDGWEKQLKLRAQNQDDYTRAQ